MTFAGEGAEFAYEVDGHAYRGWFLAGDRKRASLVDEGDVTMTRYCYALGCEKPNGLSRTKTFTVDEDAVRTSTGIVFERVR